jgi:hypothetical protein
MLKCEYPEGCRLDLWTKVIKAKYIEKGAKVLELTKCIPCADVGGYVSVVDDFKIKVNSATEILCFNKVKITIDFDLILVLIVGCEPNTEYQIYTIPCNIYEETIELSEFDPPLTPEEFRCEIDSSEIILCNWDFDYDIKGNCEDHNSPCRHHHYRENDEEGRRPPLHGSCLELIVYVDIIDKLGKMHDIIVYGELDPEIDC